MTCIATDWGSSPVARPNVLGQPPVAPGNETVSPTTLHFGDKLIPNPSRFAPLRGVLTTPC